MRKPLAVQRRDYIASTGSIIFGIKRMDKVAPPSGELFTFLGVKDGQVYLERDDKTKGEPFEIIDSSDFSRYTKK